MPLKDDKFTIGQVQVPYLSVLTRRYFFDFLTFKGYSIVNLGM